MSIAGITVCDHYCRNLEGGLLGSRPPLFLSKTLATLLSVCAFVGSSVNQREFFPVKDGPRGK